MPTRKWRVLEELSQSTTVRLKGTKVKINEEASLAQMLLGGMI
jgi:hypothetical protein